MFPVEMIDEIEKAERADCAEHAELERSVIEAEKASRSGFRRLGLLLDSLEQRAHQAAQVRQVRRASFAPKEKAAELRFERADAARQGGLGYVAFLRRAGEVLRFAHRDKITNLIHLHGAACRPPKMRVMAGSNCGQVRKDFSPRPCRLCRENERAAACQTRGVRGNAKRVSSRCSFFIECADGTRRPRDSSLLPL